RPGDAPDLHVDRRGQPAAPPRHARHLRPCAGGAAVREGDRARRAGGRLRDRRLLRPRRGPAHQRLRRSRGAVPGGRRPPAPRVARAGAGPPARAPPPPAALPRHEPESLLQAVAPALLALSGADRVVLYLRHLRTTVLIPAADAGSLADEQERVRELRLEMASAALSGLLHHHRPVAFDDRVNPAPSVLTPFANTPS